MSADFAAARRKHWRAAAYDWAWGLWLPVAAHKLLLLKLVDYCNEDVFMRDAEYRAWPGINTLARALSCDRRTVRRAVKALGGECVAARGERPRDGSRCGCAGCEIGVAGAPLTVERQSGRGNTYRLNLDAALFEVGRRARATGGNLSPDRGQLVTGGNLPPAPLLEALTGGNLSPDRGQLGIEPGTAVREPGAVCPPIVVKNSPSESPQEPPSQDHSGTSSGPRSVAWLRRKLTGDAS